ncbi:Ppx/GppA family phosphatase [Altererythrobacter sp. CC-YST694]|uniref:Ppx/GppA phosphatase family protein n=1 Tax=Altererythrobacter sp. CC-YST694 TaxID=2755038 RepID=UPI001D0353BC|nr:Ppx/GppA phosphatase family protein [Altererythrobacter sp. CC-YST694]MCB5425813.1 Ppx/GppA family phosphatase [Altererythrobacter sp. CC-YST694]
MADVIPPDRQRDAAQRSGRGKRKSKARKSGPESRQSRASGDKQEARANTPDTGGRGRPGFLQAVGNPRGGNMLPRNSYAAIDLGTNNCRLLIARPSGANFTVIDAFSRVVRLGEGLAQTGRLSDEAMERALCALKICSEKLKRRNVHLARSVATEACRRASNGDEFIERVKRETGIVLNVISAEEEARLAVLGCHILLEDGTGPAVIFDIGGGSTELVLIEQGGPIPAIVDWQSVPWGVVSLTETCGHDESSAEARFARYSEMRRLVSESFAPFAERIASARAPELRLLGTSGTVTTLASVHLDLPQYDRKAVDGLIVPSDSMRAISSRLSTLSPAERKQLPCIGNERADLVVAGCAILESILDIWPAPRLGVADRGIREGILRSLMSADNEGEQARAHLRRLKRQAS